ncbi:S1 family peptidase [Lysobacter firmicutimachus]|uniref:S1 family peptidase n=1 Tax=Lysobacter firmicutimachus TaxID=1792846 RepID=A0AAU8MZ14_9GAMM
MKKLALVTIATGIFAWGSATAKGPRDHLGYVAEYARYYGIDIGEARHRISATDRAIEIQTALRDNTPDTFSGMYVEHKPKFRVVAKFTSPPSAAIRPLLQSPAISVQFGDHSETELKAALAAVTQDLGSRGIRHLAGIEIQRSKVLVEVAPEDATRIGAAYAAKNSSIYEWRVAQGFVAPTFAPYAAYYGADRLWGSTGKICTSGFHAKLADGTAVITTAGHCDDQMRIWNSSGQQIPLAGQRVKGSLDLQWLRYSSSVYYLAPGISNGSWTYDIRAVRSKSQMIVGQHVCKYGDTTYTTCGDISRLDSVEMFNGERGNYIQVHHQNGSVMNDGGDSGGPVYAWHEGVGYAAYGIVHGRGDVGTTIRNDLFFMPSDGYAAAGLTIMVRTD